MERLGKKEPRRTTLPLTLKPSILMDLRLCGMDTGSLGPPVCAVWELSASAVQRASASSSGCSPHILLMLPLFPGELPHAPHLKPRAVCSPQLSPIDRRVASPAASRAAISTVSMFLSASHFSVPAVWAISETYFWLWNLWVSPRWPSWTGAIRSVWAPRNVHFTVPNH